MSFELFKKQVNNKSVSVIGMGISNRPLIDMLLKCDCKVTVRDKRKESDFIDLPKNCNFVFGENYLSDIKEDIVFRTPGLRFDTPELLQAKNNGSVITSEMEMFVSLCPAKIIAVTGSDGKTTTTTLISEFIKESGKRCFVGGNIGKPLLPEIDNIKEDDLVVLELSSFQLHTMTKSPQIAVITNLSPNHLDYHVDYQEYIDAKKNIFVHQNSCDKLILNRDNYDTYKLKDFASSKIIYFSKSQTDGVYLKDEYIMYNDDKIIDINSIKIPGMHNVENYMAAIAATLNIVSYDDIRKVAKEFGGVPHRIEFVREVEGVKYYNSSIDSSPNRTINTLKVFNQKVILIAGGKDKGISYDELGPSLIDKVKLLILVGKTADVIKKSAVNEAKKRNVSLDLPIEIIDSYENAVAYSKENAVEGDIVIMSNASTSFDMFKNFEERGNLFKKLVKEL